jgi:hypothetical protein
MTMMCPYCQTAMGDGAVYCRQCGLRPGEMARWYRPARPSRPAHFPLDVVAGCLGFFVVAAALYSALGASETPEDKIAAENAAWARHLDELFTPGHQIQTAAGESLWLIGPMFPDPKTGIEDHYNTRALENCSITTPGAKDDVFGDKECTKKLAARGKILLLPPASLVEIVKRDRPSGAGMIEVRVLRMGKRTTTKAERAHVWWMCDIDLNDAETWVNPAR